MSHRSLEPFIPHGNRFLPGRKPWPLPFPVLTSLLLTASLYGLLAACGGPEPQTAEQQSPQPEQTGAAEADALEKARAAAAALGADLMTTMAQEMASGGPPAAIRVCADLAQEISAQHSTEGVRVRRVTLKARNPLNRPDDYERAQLERLQQLHDQGSLPAEVSEVVEQDGERVLRYLKPIQTAELCLACHGDAASLAPEVRALIAERYPEDAATGYSAGQLRGAVSVQARLDAPAAAP